MNTTFSRNQELALTERSLLSLRSYLVSHVGSPILATIYPNITLLR